MAKAPWDIIMARVLIFVFALAYFAWVFAWLRETDARQRTTYALCGNFDTVYVHDAHWNQQARTTRVRKIPVPPSPLCKDTTR